MTIIKAEIITIGDEILYGQITDTNSQWISFELDKIGVKTIRKTSVGDDKYEILKVVNEAERRADIVLITGGLGPTNDDITKKTLVEYFDCEMKLHDEALKDVTELFHRRGRVLTETNKGQAFLPTACKYIKNPVGTAPCMWFDKNNKVVVSMPGVPYEMKEIMTGSILPLLVKQFNTTSIVHFIVRTIGIGESNLADLIKDWEINLPKEIKLAYLPSVGEVKLRLTGVDDSIEKITQKVDFEIEKLRPLIAEYIYAYQDETLEVAIGNLLKLKNKKIAVAESCTGGYLSHLFTSVSGSSVYYKGGVVAYDNEVKVKVLGVDVDSLNNEGAVSEYTIKAMAEGVRKVLKTDIGVATSGIAGPEGGTEDKPVGTVWIAYSDSEKTVVKKLQLGIKRDVNIRLASLAVLNLIRQSIEK